MSRKLTKDLIRSRLGDDNFEKITNLNLWGNNIDDISLLSEMPLLEIISLSMNHIKDLSVFSNLKNLKELYLKDNKISDFNQLEYLKNCPKLEILYLSDNPISKEQNYRKKVLEILPHLKKLDDENTNLELNKNSPPARLSIPENSFILFKKIFPKRVNKLKNIKNDLNILENEQKNNNIKEEKNKNDIISKNEDKNDLLNKSFQKKKTIGTFRKLINKKNYINLDLSVDYANGNILGNNNEIIDPNKSSFLNDYKNNNTEMKSSRNKYNKKVVGNFKKDQIKNYQSTLLTYQEFDAPIKKEENKKNLNDNNKNNINSVINKKNKNENVVLQSIRVLLETLNLSELKMVNNDIQKIIKDKQKQK